MIYGVSNLDSDRLRAIKDLEQETGRTLIAFSPLPVSSDDLADPELEKIRELEEKLGVMLVAVRH